MSLGTHTHTHTQGVYMRVVSFGESHMLSLTYSVYYRWRELRVCAVNTGLLASVGSVSDDVSVSVEPVGVGLHGRKNQLLLHSPLNISKRSVFFRHLVPLRLSCDKDDSMILIL